MKKLIKEYDLCDSVITNIVRTGDMHDVIISLDYNLGKEKCNQIKLQFCNCNYFKCDLKKIYNNDYWSKFNIWMLFIYKTSNAKIVEIYDTTNENIIIKLRCQDMIILGEL